MVTNCKGQMQGAERWAGTGINSPGQGMTWERTQNHLVVLLFLQEVRPEQRGCWDFTRVSSQPPWMIFRVLRDLFPSGIHFLTLLEA